MWIMTPHAFSSAVDKTHSGNGKLTVRFRDRDSAEWYCKLAGVGKKHITTGWDEKYRDYPYRVEVSRAQAKRYVCAEIDALAYSNFKNEATRVRGRVYHDALMKVWTAMLALTPQGVHQAMRAADKRRWAKPGRAVDWSREASVPAQDTPRTLFEDVHRADTTDADAGFMLPWEDADVEPDLGGKSIHDMTEDEWRDFMEQSPSGL